MGTLVLIGCSVIFAAISDHIPIVRNSSIMWARLPIFIIGVLCGINIEKINFDSRLKAKRLITILSWALIVVCCGCFSIRNTISARIILWFSYGILGLAVLVCIASIHCVKIEKCKNIVAAFDRWLGWVGNISLEMYLVHIPLRHLLRYYEIFDQLGLWLYAFLPLVTLPIALIGNKISTLVSKKINHMEAFK